MKLSPTFSVPSCTSTVATGPRPRSSLASSTVPDALRLALAFSSRMSADSRIISSSWSRFSRFFADTGTVTVLPPQSSGHQAQLGQLALDVVGIGAGLVDLVDGDDDRHVGRPRVVGRFLGLRHHAVVGRHHQHHDVGDLGAAGAHQGERLVTGRVEEHHAAAAHVHVVRADVLGDAAGLALGHLGLADGVEQRRLAVVHVAHHGHHRARACAGPRAWRRRPRPRPAPPRSCASRSRRRTRGRCPWRPRRRACC